MKKEYLWLMCAILVTSAAFGFGRYSQTVATTATSVEAEPQPTPINSSKITIANFDDLLSQAAKHPKGMRVYGHDEWVYDTEKIHVKPDMSTELPVINKRAEQGYIIDSMVPIPGGEASLHLVFMRKMKQPRP